MMWPCSDGEWGVVVVVLYATSVFCKKYRAFPSGLYVARKLLEIRRLISENGSAVRAPSSNYWRVRRIRGGVPLIDRGIKNTVPEILRGITVRF